MHFIICLKIIRIVFISHIFCLNAPKLRKLRNHKCLGNKGGDLKLHVLNDSNFYIYMQH